MVLVLCFRNLNNNRGKRKQRICNIASEKLHRLSRTWFLLLFGSCFILKSQSSCVMSNFTSCCPDGLPHKPNLFHLCPLPQIGLDTPVFPLFFVSFPVSCSLLVFLAGFHAHSGWFSVQFWSFVDFLCYFISLSLHAFWVLGYSACFIKACLRLHVFACFPPLDSTIQQYNLNYKEQSWRWYINDSFHHSGVLAVDCCKMIHWSEWTTIVLFSHCNSFYSHIQ